MKKTTQNPGAPSGGFTVLELMIVVALIGLLAALALPSFMRARADSQSARFMHDLRTSGDAFQQYAMDTGTFPADETPGVVPTGMAEYLPKLDWSLETTIGGNWDWDFQQFGYTAGVSVFQPDRSALLMADLDARIDDGDLVTGIFRQRAQGYIFILQM